MKKSIFTALMLAGTLILGGCTSDSSKALSSTPVRVVFGDAGWDSMRFHNAVAAFIGETAYNIKAEEVSGSTAITYSGLLKGDISVYMETWSDSLPTYNFDIEKGTIKELSVNFNDNAQGIYVPKYVIEGDPARGIQPTAPDLKKVTDLERYSTIFADPDDPSRGRIYGAISGWEVDKVLRNKIVHYGLDKFYNYMDPGSDAALAAAISGAYEKGKPIAAYYWEPTWITGKYDLVLLEDAPYDAATYYDGKTSFPSMRVTVVVNSGFFKKMPDFCSFLEKYETSSALTAEALAYIQDTGTTYEDAAKWFLKQHDELLSKWLTAQKAKVVREKLAEN